VRLESQLSDSLAVLLGLRRCAPGGHRRSGHGSGRLVASTRAAAPLRTRQRPTTIMHSHGRPPRGRPTRSAGKAWAIELNGHLAAFSRSRTAQPESDRRDDYEMWIYYTARRRCPLLQGRLRRRERLEELAVRLDDDPVTYRQLNWRSRRRPTPSTP